MYETRKERRVEKVEGPNHVACRRNSSMGNEENLNLQVKTSHADLKVIYLPKSKMIPRKSSMNSLNSNDYKQKTSFQDALSRVVIADDELRSCTQIVNS